MSKKPAIADPTIADTLVDHSDDNEECDKEKRSDEEEHALLELRLRPGHGTTMTLCVQSKFDPSDKAQIMQITSVCTPHPKAACEEIKHQLMVEGALNDAKPPVRSAPWLAALRLSATTAKVAYLAAGSEAGHRAVDSENDED